MNNRPKRNTLAGEAPQRATSGQNVPKSGERANAGTRRRNGAGSLFGENGWADEYGRIYLYYPINEVVELLHCGRQKAVNTLRELQYAGLVEIQKQGCGKPNRIYPKSYEAVPNTDFKKSGYGTPED